MSKDRSGTVDVDGIQPTRFWPRELFDASPGS